MWKDDNSSINKVLFDLGNVVFPAKCPICENKSYHMYMARFDDCDNHGGGWVWCSSCKNYSHYQYLIPSDWNNLNVLDLNELEDEPQYLEEHKEEIDDFINSYYSKHSSNK